MDDLVRAGRAVEARIEQLGMSYRAVADRAGCDTSTLWKVRSGSEPVSAATRVRVSGALGWPGDTLDRLVSDPGFRLPVSGGVPVVERVAVLEWLVAELQEQVAELRKAEG